MILEALVKIHRNTEVIKSCMKDIDRDYMDILFALHKEAKDREIIIDGRTP